MHIGPCFSVCPCEICAGSNFANYLKSPPQGDLMKNKSILSADQFSKDELDLLIGNAAKLEEAMKTRRQIPLLNEYILATMFFEPSTRTRLSFESAMHRLGGRVLTSVGIKFSSLAKGESLFDTLKVIESYADVCAIRHPVEGASLVAAKNISIPVINAGDGAGEHPTQGLLDLYTIATMKGLGENKIRVAFIGDIKFGRTIHSLIKLLSHYPVEMVFISPGELALPAKYKEELNAKNIPFHETSSIEAMHDADIAYVTRVQEERFLDHEEFNRVRNAYVINRSLLEKSNPDIRVLHPLPRLAEVSTDIDELPNAAYFKQAQNGLFMRMALLLYVLNIDIENLP